MQMKLGATVQCLATVLGLGCHFQAVAVTVTWSEPIKISGTGDVCTFGLLDRAYGMELDNPVSINGVTFHSFNVPPQPGNALPGSISDSSTEFAVAGDGDGILLEQNRFADGLITLPKDYEKLLASGLSDGGSALALNLAGLTVGQTYLLQIWVNDSRNTSASERITGGANLCGVRFNATAAYGGTGQFILGTFVADDDQQTITFSSRDWLPLINAFQLRSVPANTGLTIIKQPSPAANYRGKTVKLTALAAGKGSLTYQWQKIINGLTINLSDSDKFSGTATSAMDIRDLADADVGDYRVLVRDQTASLASSAFKVSLLDAPAEQLINVNIENGSDGNIYQGDGVLAGNGGDDFWNGIDGRNGFADVPLADSTGAKTPVTLTLAKSRPDGYTSPNTQNDLLKDYSPNSVQTITFNHLEPNIYYNLVVYSIGAMQNEGGVFSGALNGIVHGGSDTSDFWASRFLLHTNYIQNPFALSDANGALQFNIRATSSVFSDGFYNGDFNGLQIRKVATNNLAPYILLQPLSVAAYPDQPVSLTVKAIGPPASPLTYQWRQISPAQTKNLIDDENLHGSTTPSLVISNLTAWSAGDYCATVSDPSGCVTSLVATASLRPSPHLINVDIKNPVDPCPTYNGNGVLRGLGGNFWNRINGRESFTNVPLRDNDGNPTSVTLSLVKDQVDSYTSPVTANDLLKDYSVGHPQTIILRNLQPDTPYRLVVYSFGAMENEGGAFSGAVSGIVHGWSGSPFGVANNFVEGTNYIENSSAQSDAHGTLIFTIQPTLTIDPKGFYNCDFNGLQVMDLQ